MDWAPEYRVLTHRYHDLGVTVKTRLWDTAGQEKFGGMLPSFYKLADAAIIMYDITNRDSFEACDNWLAELLANNMRNGVAKLSAVSLVGSKDDSPDEKRQVTYAQGEAKAARWSQMMPTDNVAAWPRVRFIECSPKTGHGVQRALAKLVREFVGVRGPLLEKEVPPEEEKSSCHVM